MAIPAGAPKTNTIKKINIFGSFRVPPFILKELPVAKARGMPWIISEIVNMIYVYALSETPIAMPSVSWWINKNIANVNKDPWVPEAIFSETFYSSSLDVSCSLSYTT